YQVFLYDFDRDTDKDLFLLTSHTGNPVAIPAKPGLKRIAVQASTDCNQNRISDYEETSQGISPDCNCNGLPDSCDLSLSATRPASEKLTLNILTLNDLGVTDVNLDGKADLVLPYFSSNSSTNATYIGLGDGAFELSGFNTPRPFSWGNQEFVFEDINRDGVKDILWMGYEIAQKLPRYYPFLISGNRELNPLGSWHAPTQLLNNAPAAATYARLGDFDGDGDLDLVSNIYNSNSQEVFQFFANDGQPSFTRSLTSYIRQNTSRTDMVIGRIDSDNIDDVLAIGSYGWRSLLSRGNSVFEVPRDALNTYPETPYPQYGPVVPNSIIDRLVDYNLDGLGDMLSFWKSSELLLQKNMGDGTFSTVFSFNTSQAASRFVDAFFQDVNGDGRPELATLESQPALVRMFRFTQNGGVYYTAPLPLPVQNIFPYDGLVRLADVDGDGHQDLIVAYTTQDNAPIEVQTFFGPIIPFSLDLDFNSVPDECQGG
ncbi:MAG: hypothetical protein DCC75_12705, partial [Proteobacteria bacterium]